MNDVWVIFDLLLTDKENGYHNSNKMHWDERSTLLIVFPIQ